MEQSPARARFAPADTVDFVIVGSGAAGGIIAKELATAGFSVVVLEQGPRLTEKQFDHDEFATFMQGRWSNNPATQPQSFRTSPSANAETALAAIYGRLVGGSNAHFTGNFWRMRPLDFNEASVLGGVAGHGTRRLADHLRGARAVLHQGRVGTWRVRRTRTVRSASFEAVPDALAAHQVVGRAVRQGRPRARLSPAADADGHQLALLQRPAGLPALRLLPVLHVRVPIEVIVFCDDAADRGSHRQMRGPSRQLRGTHRDQQRRPGHGCRVLRRQEANAAAARQGRGAVRQRRRNTAPAAQFGIHALSERPRQFERHGRQAPDVQHLLRRQRTVRAAAQRAQERAEHAHDARLLRHRSEARILRRRRHRCPVRQVPDHLRARRAAARIADLGRGLRPQSGPSVHADDVLRDARHVAAARSQQREHRSVAQGRVGASVHADHLQGSSRRPEDRGVPGRAGARDRAGSRRTQGVAGTRGAADATACTCWERAGWATIRSPRSSIAFIGRTTCGTCSSATAAAWSPRHAVSPPRRFARWPSVRARRSRSLRNAERSSSFRGRTVSDAIWQLRERHEDA